MPFELAAHFGTRRVVAKLLSFERLECLTFCDSWRPMTAPVALQKGLFCNVMNTQLRTFVVSFTLAAGSAKRRSKMRYQTDRRSRTRAIAVYATLLIIGAALGFLVRFGVITDHIFW